MESVGFMVNSATMESLLLSIASRFWPELKSLTGQKYLVGVGEVIITLYSAPLAAAGFVWLLLISDINQVLANLPLLLFFALLMFLFRRLGFFIIAEIRAGRYASSDGSMESMVLWSAVFLLGPEALWLAVLWSIIDFLFRWQPSSPVVDKWSRARNFFLYQASVSLAPLITLQIFYAIGGKIPIPDLSPQSILYALVALGVHFFLVLLFWSVFIAYSTWTQIRLTGSQTVRPVLNFLLIALFLPALSHPFSILAAGLFEQNGLVTFLFFFAGLLQVALLTRQLSWAAESSRQQSRQLRRLEQLSRDILNAPPEGTSLPIILREHVPSMFPSGRVALWIEEQGFLLSHPIDWELEVEPVWGWLRENKDTGCFLSKDPLPWSIVTEEHNALVVAPIVEVDSERTIGIVYLELYSLAQPWDFRSLTALFPAVKSLAAQVASALNQEVLYNQSLDYQRVSQELALAGKIQASFLPDELPPLPGWELAVAIRPARETSGDFFDLIPLSEGQVGILIADVADKGVGAALYMALSRTLIRTYAIEFDDSEPQPEVVFFAANGRILKDARADMFVTAFYGILNQETGLLTYCNAGHNPPYLLRCTGDDPVRALGSTGMPMGVEEDELWERAQVIIEPGDVLVLYTDGIPDAMNGGGEFLGDSALQEEIKNNRGLSAQHIQDLILERVQSFVSGAPQFDDITLMVLGRDL